MNNKLLTWGGAIGHTLWQHLPLTSLCGFLKIRRRKAKSKMRKILRMKQNIKEHILKSDIIRCQEKGIAEGGDQAARLHHLLDSSELLQ